MITMIRYIQLIKVGFLHGKDMHVLVFLLFLLKLPVVLSM